MSETRWEGVKRIVDQALDTPDPEERRRFLETACEGDDELRQAVELLLRGGDVSRLETETTEAVETATKFRGYLSAWYAYGSIIAFSFCLAVALYGFKVSLAGRPAFRDFLAE